MQGYSVKQTTFLTPVMFGVAHVHHVLEMVRFQGAKLSSALAVVRLNCCELQKQSLNALELVKVHKPRHNTVLHCFALQAAFQFAFTTIFGWYATHVFLNTGHLVGAVATHSFCNWMGFPPVGDAVHHPHRKFVLAAYFAGIVTFSASLGLSALDSGKDESYLEDLITKATSE